MKPTPFGSFFHDSVIPPLLKCSKDEVLHSLSVRRRNGRYEKARIQKKVVHPKNWQRTDVIDFLSHQLEKYVALWNK
ncbi:hypothetical protein Y032_0963g3230 [Ancylostoma ceylanicum]|uniref:Uncharacterized protein n=1 Tax=Ancylostoma ceylanicum TaxID=53326 RepID=A0A016W9C9_9BILA|nr:hypothetical protein Y032_0963g3230 [Ancylostoma ceylanicum]